MQKTIYEAKHILLEDLEDAIEVRERISAGTSFEEAAREFSECETSTKGGNLGRFTSGTMVPEFEKALYHLELGKLSDPIKTKFGYHLIIRLK